MVLLAEIEELEKLEQRKQELLMGKPVHALATPRPKVPAPSPATSAAATPTEPTPPTETPSDEEEIGNGLIGDFKTESTDINITANTVKIC